MKLGEVIDGRLHRAFAEHHGQQVPHLGQRQLPRSEERQLLAKQHQIGDVQPLMLERLWPAISEAIILTTGIANVGQHPQAIGGLQG